MKVSRSLKERAALIRAAREKLTRELDREPALSELCERTGLSGTEELAQRIAYLKELGGLRRRLSDLGEVDLDKLCHDCAVHVLMNNNPVKMDEAALREMFEALK